MKKDLVKKLLSFALVGTMALGLAACGSKDEGGTGGAGGATAGGTGTGVSQTDITVAKSNVYSEEVLDFDFGTSDYSFYDAKAIDSKIYLAVSTYDYNSADRYAYAKLGCYNEATGKTSYVTLEDPEELANYVVVPSNGGADEGATDGADGSGEAPAGGDVSILPLADEPADAIASDDTFIGTDDYDYGDYTYEGVEEYTNYNYQNLKISESGYVTGIMDYSYSYYDYSTYYSEYTDTLFIVCWNFDGSVAWCVNLSELLDSSWMYVNASATLSDGSALFFTYGDEYRLIAVDASGNVTKNIDSSELSFISEIGQVVALKDDSLIATYYDEANNWNTVLAKLDPNTFKPVETYSLPENLNYGGVSGLTAGVDTDFVCSSSTGLFKFNLGDTEAVEFMNYINSDLAGYSLYSISMIDENSFIASYSGLQDYNTVISKFSYVDPSTIPDKEVINVAVYYVDYNVKSRIVEYNKTSDKYRIVITDYSQYATDDDYYAGYTKLNNEIIAGNIPDVIMMDTFNFDYKSLAKKGMFADIKELIANDSELSQYSYLENVFNAYTVDDKCYLLIPYFDFTTSMGSTTYFDKDGMSVSEFKNFVKSNPNVTLMDYLTRSDFLNYMMMYGFSDYVNTETGECNFNSESFITMLEYAASLPEEFDWNNIPDDYWMNYEDNYRSGRVALMNISLYDLSSYQYDVYCYFNGKGTLVGFPNDNGSRGVIYAYSPMSISASGNVNGAWDFARYFLSPEYQNTITYDIPVLQSAFDKWAAKGGERPYWEDENGEKNYYDNYYYVDGVEVTIPPMTDDEINQIKEAITTCTNIYNVNSDILGIIEEEASACFSGQKSASDVAAIIQSRVALYIAENS